MSNTLLPRLAARLHTPADPPDAALLGRFAAERCEEAFALLVARHGPMVFAVCRRVLGNTADADDAFQAAFLVLVRRASDVRHADRLAGWLYGVAYRSAVEARGVRATRRRRETTGEVPDVPQVPLSTDSELSAVVERELAALPDQYRLAVALCDLDGRSRTEAASLLGIPEGTLSSRLNAGRKRLADRLARRGYGPAVLVAVTPAVNAATVEHTIRLASAAVPAPVQSLCDGVIRAMTAKRNLIGWAVAGLFASALVVTTAALAAPDEKPAAAKVAAKADKPDGGDKKVSDALPVVVKTVPAAGDEAVDPGLTEVRVTFSKEMMDKSWSWATDTGRGADLPGTGKPAYDKDKKTCVLPVKLQPETTYAVWLNGGKFMSFMDADKNSSLPYLLVFRTGKAK
jgi:RNA polymerase sigma factor (sigma-70 family)